MQEGEHGRRYPARYGSITWNDRESKYSQAKIELFGLYRALHAYRLYLFGVHELHVEVDAKYIKGMLNNPDIQPNATINRWIAGILLFNPIITHVPASKHSGPDGLSRRPRAPEDPLIEEDVEEWLDRSFNFMIEIFNNRPVPIYTATDSLSNSKAIRDPSEEEEIPLTSQIEEEEIHSFRIQDEKTIRKDEELPLIIDYLENLAKPPGISLNKLRTFVKRCSKFFILRRRLFRRDELGKHKLVIGSRLKRSSITKMAHDELGHKGFYPTRMRILDRFWWPGIDEDIHWHIQTCHQCQIRSTIKVKIPPVVAPIAALFRKAYMDTMKLPRSNKYTCVTQLRDSLTSWPEGRMLMKETGATIGKFVYEDVLCRWGAIEEIVTDNGSAMIKALEWLSKKYKINHIRISGYNSQANGAVERKHYDVRESLVKAANENGTVEWPIVFHSVLWAERVTVKKSTGMSPYYMVHGVEPILPFDLAEATYMTEPLAPPMSTSDLISIRAKQLQKRPEDLDKIEKRVKAARFDSIKRFENKYENSIHDYNFKPGELVLVRNTRVEKELNRKTKPRYLGPMLVIKRHGETGSYVLSELDGSVSIIRCGAFRLIPYHPRRNLVFNVKKIIEDALDRLKTMDLIDEEPDEASL
jgi:hypothetical protein